MFDFRLPPRLGYAFTWEVEMFIVLELWFVSILFVFVNISREGDDYWRPCEYEGRSKS
jgi:hypothetical protein